MLLWEKPMQIKKNPSWETSIIIKKKKKMFWFVYTRLHSSRLIYNRLDSPSDSSVFLEQIDRDNSLERERFL